MQTHSRPTMALVEVCAPDLRRGRPGYVLPFAPSSGYYVVAVVPSLDVRRKRFAAFVRRANEHAKATLGLSIPQIATKAKISNQSIYRWQDGNWKRPPEGEAIRAYCDALDIDPAGAFAILWPGKDDRAPRVEPLPDPDITALARRIQDPKVTSTEKALLRNSIQFLLGRSMITSEREDDAPTEGDEEVSAG